LLALLNNPADISALVIAAIGALFSIASALYLTSRKISAEFRFRRADLSNTYAENLLLRRLELYPEIWQHLGAYGKKFPKDKENKPTANVSAMKQLHENISEWDSTNGLIMSTHTAKSCHKFRKALRQMLDARKEDSGTEFLTKEEHETIRDNLAILELALRIDIGIYEVEQLEARQIMLRYGDISRNRPSPSDADR
jgi:hypothetical protein